MASREKSKFVGAILAAGRGSRMEPFGDQYPKPTLPICNKPLISYQIELMRSIGIDEVVVLLGHRGYEIAKLLGDGRGFGVSITYVEQTELLGLAYAVGCLEPYVDRPFVLFLADIFFVAKDFGLMFRTFEEQGGGAVLAATEEEDVALIRKNFSVTLGDDGMVRRVIEKPRYPTNHLKGVGLYVFDLSIFDAIRRTPRTAMRNEYEITDSIQVMIDDGHPVRVANAVTNDWNVTTAADLLAVNLDQAKTRNGENMIGERCNLHPGVRIEDSIVGSDVSVLHPISIRRSVIFDGTELHAEEPVDYSIVTPQVIVDCSRPAQTRKTRD